MHINKKEIMPTSRLESELVDRLIAGAWILVGAKTSAVGSIPGIYCMLLLLLLLLLLFLYVTVTVTVTD